MITNFKTTLRTKSDSIIKYSELDFILINWKGSKDRGYFQLVEEVQHHLNNWNNNTLRQNKQTIRNLKVQISDYFTQNGHYPK